MKKQLLATAVSTAMLSSLVLYGSAFAADRVEVKVTSEPIQSRSTCDKVGGFSLEFDSATSLLSGDRITIDTDYVTPSNFTALCRSIDLLIAPDATGSSIVGNSGLSWDATNVLISGAATPVYYDTTIPTATAGGVNFHVYGSAGTQRITFDVVGDTDATSALTVGPGLDDKLGVKFLDQSVNADFTDQPGIWINSVGDEFSIYETAATIADNTLCLNVESWDAATVNGNMDSTADKYTFIPSNPQIAHIVSAAQYAVVPCKGATCGDVSIGALAQTGDTCSSFTDAPASGYCPTGDVHRANDLIISRTDGMFANDDYQVTMEILVNGVSGDNGVYFAGDVGTAGATTNELACDAAITPVTTTAYLATGAVATESGATGCDVAADARAVKVVTDAGNLGLNGTTHDFLKLAVPTMVYDLDDVSDQDAVTVRVTLTRAPCGEIITTDHCVGSLVNSCSIISSGNSINFPYFTEGNTDGFWDGIALNNTTSNAGTVTLTMYEADGDVATATVPIAAMSIYVNTLETMIANGDFTLVTSVDGTLGNAKSQIVASSTTLTIDGFAMMGNNATGLSMGYLPRMYNLSN